MRMRLEVRLAKRVGRGGDDIECRGRNGARRQIRSASQTVKRRGEEFIELDDVRQRQYVEDPEATAQSGLAIGEGVPGNSYTRFKVPGCGVAKQRITQVGRGIRELPENGQFFVNFCRYGRHFIPQAQINGDVLPPMPIVLEICPDDRLAKAPLGDGAGYSRGQEKGLICQKVGKRVEGKNTIGIGSRQDVVPDSLHPTPEFEGVTAPRKRNVVVGLNGGPVEMVAPYRSQTTHKSRQARNDDTGRVAARHGSERRVRGERVSTCEGQTGGRYHAIDSKSERIHETRAKRMCFV